jgi:hypothetical protein
MHTQTHLCTHTYIVHVPIGTRAQWYTIHMPNTCLHPPTDRGSAAHGTGESSRLNLLRGTVCFALGSKCAQSLCSKTKPLILTSGDQTYLASSVPLQTPQLEVHFIDPRLATQLPKNLLLLRPADYRENGSSLTTMGRKCCCY